MRGEAVVANQRLMALAIFALADHIEGSSGYRFVPSTFAQLPSPAAVGSLACVSDSTVNIWGSVIAGGGGFTVLAFYDGSNWTVR
ncbi:MAG: hypothetical protein C5B60_03440 [Chloroflexi bacterium]|nr:MAG: hypothetical protein C5B60_03440 [Chloroflexota bacterium]